MTDVLWPGDDRAGDLFSDASFVVAMTAVEEAWLDALAGTGIAPPTVGKLDLQALLATVQPARLAADAEAGGNPAMPLVAALRDRLGEVDPEAARWLHRGLTSQDVVDTALMLCARDAVRATLGSLREQVRLLSDLAERHRHTPMVARTLTQHAVPTTFGLKAALWLTGVLDAYDDLAALVFPVQLGGAAGTMAATVELAGHLSLELATALDLTPSTPWHTVRTSVTRIGDAAVRVTDACGRIAGDVLTLARPEIGELSEGVGGGSSTMPHKANPVLSVLVRRAALSTPQLAATLHLSAADAADERAAGGWHAEWSALRTLVRRTVVAAAQTTDLVAGLQVHEERMAATLAAEADVRAEQAAMSELTGREPRPDYLGAGTAFLEAPLARAAGVLAEEAR
jgi:3-carboxy-cis,cis-muconate cycloisomerase